MARTTRATQKEQSDIYEQDDFEAELDEDFEATDDEKEVTPLAATEVASEEKVQADESVSARAKHTRNTQPPKPQSSLVNPQLAVFQSDSVLMADPRRVESHGKPNPKPTPKSTAVEQLPQTMRKEVGVSGLPLWMEQWVDRLLLGACTSLLVAVLFIAIEKS